MEWDTRYATSRTATGAPVASASVGNVVFVSGCTAGPAGEPAPARVEDQVELALETARLALEAAGSRMENVVKTFFLLTRLEDYGAVRRTETELYERLAPQLVTTPPAATLMVAPSLGDPAIRVQYEVVAALDRAAPGWEVTYHPERWAGRELAYPHVPKEHAKFARSQSVGNLLVVSGCQALDHDTLRVETDDVGEQSRVVLDKVRVALEETGGSLAELVKTNVFVKDAAAAAIYRDVERAFFREHAPGLAADPPASSTFLMTELPRPEFLVEVEAFALAHADPAWPLSRRSGTAGAAESVTAGRLVFTSACDGGPDEPTAGPVELEVAAVLDRLRGVLTRAGSAIDRLARVTLLVGDTADRPAVERALLDWYRGHAPGLAERPPATTFVPVTALVPTAARLQVDAVAVA